MEKPRSQENAFAVETISQNALDSIPESDTSESVGSQNKEIDVLSYGEVLASASDDDDRSHGSLFADDIFIQESDPSESDNSQVSRNQLQIDEEITVPAAPSQSEPESTPQNSQEPRNDTQISPTDSNESSTISNNPEVEEHLLNSHEDIIYETEPSESENNGTPENEFIAGTDRDIREMHSQRTQENSPNHQQSPLSDNVSERSESDNSQFGNDLLVDNELNIPDTPSQSDQENTPSHEHQNNSPQTPNRLSAPESPAISQSNNTGYLTLSSISDLQRTIIGDILVYETDDSENGDSPTIQNNHVIDSEISIPGTPSESDEEDSPHHSDDEPLQTANNKSIPSSSILSPISSVENSRHTNHSPDLFDDVDDFDAPNIAEVDTESPTRLNSSDLLNESGPNLSQDDEVIPSSIEHEFRFVIPGSPQNDHRNDSPLVETIEIHSSSESEVDEDDDDVTILREENSSIRISERSRAIIKRIERFILGILDNLRNGERIQIVVQSRSSWDNCNLENERFNLLPIADARCRHIKSTFNLSVIFYVLGEIHEMLSTNRMCTVRELYYKNVNITQKQENVSEALKTICCILEATPWELGVLSTSKGLIAGPLEIHLPDNSIVDCNIDKHGITLPHLTAEIIDLRTTATHILVVEKDTVFKKLLQNNIIERWENKCILITGKGYPDTNTRLILNKLRELHAIPINVFTDADPYGIEIMLTYRHGSMSMSNLAESLAVPSVRWLGIFPSDIRKFGINSIPLTAEDKRKLDNILNRPFINDHVHRELLVMKQTNVKAEIEGISDSSCTYLIDVYLRNKIDHNDGI